MQKLIYVNKIGKNSEGTFTYEFYFSEDDLSLFWLENAEVKPASIANIQVPPEGTFSEMKVLKTNIKLNSAQNNTSFSLQDCFNNVLSLVWEDISEYEEYPENGRIVFQFGTDIMDVERMLGSRDLAFENKFGF